jgi:hypothetical protein
VNEKYVKTLGLHQYLLIFLLSDQSDFFEVAEPSANQGGVDQIVARAKYRPDSGVTVIDVPKTADM